MEGHGLFSGMKNWKLPEMGNRIQIMAVGKTKKKIKEWPDKFLIIPLQLRLAIPRTTQDNHLYFVPCATNHTMMGEENASHFLSFSKQAILPL